MGYHISKIPKGTLGEFSKIKEEFLEAEDAVAQKNPIMLMCELSDIIGAIELHAEKYNITLSDLIKMKDATKRAFKTGRRK
jgi:hypothetical protein